MCQRHAGGAEPDAQIQPLQVRLALGAAAAGRPLHRGGEQALALVEAQCVHAEPGALGSLPDAEARLPSGDGVTGMAPRIRA